MLESNVSNYTFGSMPPMISKVCRLSLSYAFIFSVFTAILGSPWNAYGAAPNAKKPTTKSLDTGQDALRGIQSTTSNKVVIMPVIDKSGQRSSLPDFATEVLNQSIRNGGISTVAWFKVEKQLKTELASSKTSSSNPLDAYSTAYAAAYAATTGINTGSSILLANDSNLNELITAGKKLGARYILRSVILKQSSNTEAKTRQEITFQTIFGLGSPYKIEQVTSAEVDVKVDIISTAQEDIIASRTFSGRSVSVDKERANRLDGITGMQIFGSGGNNEATQIAFYDTIDKIVEFLQAKTP